MINSLKKVIEIIKVVENWPLFLMDYFKLIGGGLLTYKLRNGIKFKTRAKTTDFSLIYDICIRKSYLPKGISIKETDTVVDIGANIGVFSILASKYTKNNVFAFEPVLENFKLLESNIRLNKAKNIIPIRMAIADKEGEKSLFISSNNPGGHSFHFKDECSKKIVVKTVPLKIFFEQYNFDRIDFLKMDCEGAEYEILYTSPKYILKKIRTIVMEYHEIDNCRNYNSLRMFFENNGFEIWKDPDPNTHILLAKQ